MLTGGLIPVLCQAVQAGPPSRLKNIPAEIKIPKGVELVAALDDENPEQVSKKAVYYRPSNRTIRLDKLVWNENVLTDGRRGGICDVIDGQIATLDQLEERSSKADTPEERQKLTDEMELL